MAKKQTNFKEIVVKENEKGEIVGSCPYCGAIIFREHKDKAFVGEFHFCYECGVELEPYPPKEEEGKEKEGE